jgi:hypothetical protein
MTSKNPSCEKRKRWAHAERQTATTRATELQVLEYIKRYYPQMVQVNVEITPGSAIAIARLRKSD